MPEICNHTSVGMLVQKDDRILLIERAKEPYGFALPAGHVDDGESYEDAARRELQEEVGLVATTFELIAEGRKENRCRREDGMWHEWKIYRVGAEGELNRSETETKRAGWYTKAEIQDLATRTDPGLEPVMREWLTQLGVL